MESIRWAMPLTQMGRLRVRIECLVAAIFTAILTKFGQAAETEGRLLSILVFASFETFNYMHLFPAILIACKRRLYDTYYFKTIERVSLASKRVSINPDYGYHHFIHPKSFKAPLQIPIPNPPSAFGNDTI